MNLQNQGEDIVRAARGWIGTNFHHQGRLKRSASHAGGCDCLGLLVGVANELELSIAEGNMLLAGFDVTDYGHIPDLRRLITVFESLFTPVAMSAMAQGDVALMRFDAVPQHLGIISHHPQGGLGIIHALASARKVVEHRLDAAWQQRIHAVYRLPANNQI